MTSQMVLLDGNTRIVGTGQGVTLPDGSHRTLLPGETLTLNDDGEVVVETVQQYTDDELLAIAEADAAELRSRVEAAPLGPGPESVPTGQPYRMLLALVGSATSDGRIFDALTWRETPLSLLWQPENEPGHDGSVVVGRIDRIVRDGDEVWGYGVMDTVGEHGREAIRLIAGGFLKGVSIDAAVLEVTEGDDGLMHFRAEVGAVTIVAFPAFRETQIELEDAAAEGEEALAAAAEAIPAVVEERGEFHGVGLVAAWHEVVTPAAWFAQPPDTGRREALHVEADGRVWGHIYEWGQCHTGSPQGQCVQAQPSRTSYAYFLTGHVLTDAGEVATGPIVLSADHAALSAGWSQARDHYANSGLAVADVTVGEDAYGIWVAGCVRPGTPDEMLHALRASAPSGDWRPIGAGLELVAILSVNTPGFPALAASYSEGVLTALVASVGRAAHDCGCGGTGASAGLQERLERLDQMWVLTAPLRDRQAEEWAAELGVSREQRLAALDAEMS